jgi:hypothetical protein
VGQNTTGRGLWTPEPTLYTTPPSSVFAWDDTSQTWKPGKAVWTWDPDVSAWVIIWGANAVAPVSPTATYADTPTQLTIAWTLPPDPVSIDQWEVIRVSDSAVVATVAPTVTSYVDANPLPVASAFTVRGRLGTLTQSASTASIDLRLLPASMAAAYSNPNVTVTAPEPTLGAPDFYRLYVDDRVSPQGGAVGAPNGPYFLVDVAAAGGALSYVHNLTSSLAGGIAGRWFGHQLRYYLTSVLSGHLSANDSTPDYLSANVDVPGLAPGSLTINRRSAGLGTVVDFTWVPAQGAAGPWDVQKSLDNTTWSNVLVGYTGSPSITTTGGPPLYVRVRNSPYAGGESAYVQAGPV